MGETLSIIPSPQKKNCNTNSIAVLKVIKYFYLNASIPVISAPVINK